MTDDVMWRGRRAVGWARAAVVTAVSIVAWALPGAGVAGPADAIPADAMAAYAWSGFDAEDAGSAYAGSRLRAVLEATDLAGRINRAVNASLEEQAQWDDEAKLFQEAWNEVAPVAWRRPWVVYFQGLEWPGEDAPGWAEPRPRMGFVIEPGEDAAVVGPWLQRLYDLIEQESPELDLALVDDGTRMGLLMGSELAADAAASLGATERFAEAMAQADGDDPTPAVWGYVDLAALDQLIRDGIAREDADGLVTFEDATEDLGVDILETLVFTGGFDGTDWRQALFLGAPAPRSGWMTLMDQPTVGDAALAAVPRTATWIRVSRMDFGEVWDVALEGVVAVAPEAEEQIDGFTAAAREFLGFDLRDDLLGAMGDAWTMYADPTLGGMFGTGIVLTNPTPKPERLQASLTQLEDLLNAQLADNGTPFRFAEQPLGDDATVHTMALPFVSPSWAVVDGRWVFGLSPSAIAAARLHAAAPDNSLGQAGDDHAYHALAARLPQGKSATSVAFADYARTAPELYQGFQMGMNLFAMQAAGMGDQMPFNPADLLLPLVSISAGFMVPALTEARASARQTASMSNVRQIAIGLHAYAADHDDRFPETLGQLVEGGYLVREVFNAPGDPESWQLDDVDDEQVVDAVDALGSYLLLRPGLALSDVENAGSTPVLIEHPRVWRDGFRYVVAFADGHAEIRFDFADPEDPTDTRRLIEEQTGRTLDDFVAERDAAADALLDE